MKRILYLLGPTAALVLIFIIATQTAIYVGTHQLIYDDIQEVPQVQAVIIPGAAVLINRELSSVFKDRVDTAIRLYNAGKVSKILVSGGNSTVENNEVNPVRNYLLERDIPDEDIFLDHAGFDTYSTMYRARAIFQVTSAVVASQAFHLPRAVFLGRNLGIAAYGLSADNEKHNLLLRNYFREFFAKEKAMFELIIGRKPKYLGEQIPITGDGRNYP